MSGRELINDLGRERRRRQGRPRPQQPSARKAVDYGERGMATTDDPAARFVDDMDRVRKMPLGGEVLEHRPAGGRRLSKRHELETRHSIPAPKSAHRLAANATFVVVQDRQRSGDDRGAGGVALGRGQGGHGAE